MVDTQPPSANVQRLFFALMPPAGIAKAIAARGQTLALDGRVVDTKRLHLTLAFLGRIEAEACTQLCEKASRVQAPAFTLVLDRLGCFVRPGIVWLGPSAVPSPLLDLAAKLDKNTASAIEKGRYRPHVTIRRKAMAVEGRAIVPIEWPVSDFSLIASGESGRPGIYRELGRWPLGARSVGPRGL
ncbi:2'-5' RNA ligase [Salinisphaera sp. T5B8]|uniref:RNA 2',3'-cyclic phosphodiesterase n=1 Tax=Salinisphaera sp. T5B8 TaxID=1304154 RepID=UPI0033413459